MSIDPPTVATAIPDVLLLEVSSVENPEDNFFVPSSYEDCDNNRCRVSYATVKEFIRHCNGGGQVYVSSLKSPVPCEANYNDNMQTYNFTIKTKALPRPGMVLVSKKPLKPREKSLPVTAEESERLEKAEKPARASLDKKKILATPAYIKKTFSVTAREIRESLGVRHKLSTPSGFIYISSVGLIDDVTGWNIANIVFHEANGKLQSIGWFPGCIVSFRDLNADGTPEVFTTLCENSEGRGYSFWSLTPKIRSVIEWSQ